jgi:hypothetical protein
MNGRPMMVSQMAIDSALPTRKFVDIRFFSLHILILIRSNQTWRAALTMKRSSVLAVGPQAPEGRAPLLTLPRLGYAAARCTEGGR